jgi:ADP-heptose:LPS heptosyltransferase
LINFANKKNNTHYLDGLKKILNLELAPIKVNKRENSKLIAFQVSTSDSKKNYDLLRWKKIIQTIKFHLPEYQVKVFCTSKEVDTFKRHFSKEDLMPSGFANVYQVLKEACLLASLDTSVKHLAALAGTPVLELSIGSSHPTKTATYSEGNYILSALQTCRPCDHSAKCPYLRNLCQDSISEKTVSDFVINWIHNVKLTHFDMKTVIRDNYLGFEKGKLWITSKNNEICI